MGANQRVPQGQEIAMVHILDLNKRERTVLDTHIHKRMNVQRHLHNYISKCIPVKIKDIS